jgi:hypothetical protein
MIVKNNGNSEIEVNGETGVNRDELTRIMERAMEPKKNKFVSIPLWFDLLMLFIGIICAVLLEWAR